MSPLDFMFSPAAPLDKLAFKSARTLGTESLPQRPWAGLPAQNGLAFEGAPNLTKLSFFRVHNGCLQIASPFGCYELDLGAISPSEPLGVLCMQAGARLGSWTLRPSPEWRGLREELADEWALKSRPLENGDFEPLRLNMWARGADSSPDFWVIILLPARALRVFEKDGRARIETACGFLELPPGKDSELALAGHIQWGLPNEDGVFVLEPRLN